ncbi:MAG TPA: DNA alkylation repair protein [Candidatus Butyricicoccus stercorigallinarum]|nr:DNA alkylation repair protein [Candidatus Butyricicoccus stercorigallinarum]
MRDALRARLLALAEEDYRAFAASLIPGCRNLIGVRLPRLRALARELAPRAEAYLAAPCGDWFEEIQLRGMVIGCMRCPTEQRLRYIRAFVPLIDNWSVCDSFCAGLKEARREPETYWAFVLPYLRAPREFEVRFGVVMLLDHFAQGDRIPRVLEQLEQVTHPGFYARMAVAWAVSVCYARAPADTQRWLRRGALDAETARMAVRKILDSRRVTGEPRAWILRFRDEKKNS